MTDPSQPRPSELLARFDVQLWVLVVVFFVVGDLATTSFGLTTGSIVETGPIAAPVIDSFGLSGMLGLKLGVVLAFYGLWWMVPEPENAGIPLGLAVMGILVTGWNCYVLLGSS